MTERVYLAFGTNVGERLQYLRQALVALVAHPEMRLSALSHVYETKPVGLTDQPDFLNMVAAFDTSLTPTSLIRVTQSIERAHGRKRTIRWGPRTLDLDILLYGDQTVCQDQLVVPHPRMTERAFVLLPLAELAPDLIVPGTGRSVSRLVEQTEGKEGVQPCPTISLAAEFGLSEN